jgi:NAD(P)-dependent dehydrogenase (short-subunit alcohol dehydrogenase family)
VTERRNWFITGSSRGFGLALARAALAHGDRVVASARNAADVERALASDDNLMIAELDVTDDGEIADAAASALDRFGHIDILVNNAGFGMIGAIEETARAETSAILDVNVSGLVATTRAFLPSMRQRGSGHIINVSSAGGYTGSPGWGVYGATKWAVEGLTETMAMELAGFGIRVTAVALDSYATGFMDAAHHTAEQNDVYAATSGMSRQLAAKPGGFGQKDVGLAAEAVYRATCEADPPLHLPIGELALTVARATTAQRQREIERWAALSSSGG